jgi:hypothetical protein
VVPQRWIQYDQYKDENWGECLKDNSTNNFLMPLSLLNKINKIEGWLDDQEADLLMAIALNVRKTLLSPYNIVEIGSYHGKSTVLFGTIIKNVFTSGKIYAIDPHDGLLGAADQGLQTFPSSYEMFKKNIETAGLTEVVEVIRSHSCNVKWELPVSLLFIDGLHDYLNVAKDFWHFEEWICSGGYVAFHDYADYFPGVKQFVDELLAMGTYSRIQITNTLIILQKLGN